MTKLHSLIRHAGVRTTLLGLIAAAVASTAAHAADFTDTKAYVTAVSPDYVFQPLLSVGDRVPNTSNSSRLYQMIGIPDGLGAYKAGKETILFMCHELGNSILSEPNIGGTQQRGAFVSRFVLDQDAAVLSGEIAYDVVVDEEKKQRLPRPEAGNQTPGFARFCSGSLS